MLNREAFSASAIQRKAAQAMTGPMDAMAAREPAEHQAPDALPRSGMGVNIPC